MNMISPVTSSIVSLSNLPAGGDKNEKSIGAKEEALPAAQSALTAEPAESTPGEKVSLSANAASPDSSDLPAPIYAEIWRDGVKLAQIDVHGHVTSYSGLVASGGGSGLAGQVLAAQRAVQVAQQIGGEIRTAGQSVDSQTLLMRAQLARAYAV